MSTKRINETERNETRERLLALLPPGSTVYAVLRSVSRSGMQRTLDFYCIETPDPDRCGDLAGLRANIMESAPRPRYLTGHIATMTGRRRNNAGALVISGCGFDAAWDVVMSLARALYPDGYTCLGDRCPASDHRNHPRDTFERHAPGDYALRAEWL